MWKKIGSFLIITLLIFVICLFSNLFINCIKLYSAFDIDYNDLRYAELTFEKYELIKKYKSGDFYEIYFEEYDKPFEISSITKKEVDKNLLNNLKYKDKVKVYFIDNSSQKYPYEICEMKSKNAILLELSNFKDANQENQVVGMIMCPIMILAVLCLMILYIRWVCNEKTLLSQIKEKKESEILGKVKIEYIKDENTIRIYNSLEMCSLVINGNVVDKYIGFVSAPFCLKGKIISNDKVVLVEAKMGHLFMKLYYDGKVVCKKFMGLG